MEYTFQSLTIVHPNSIEEEKRVIAEEAERVKHIFPGAMSNQFAVHIGCRGTLF